MNLMQTMEVFFILGEAGWTQDEIKEWLDKPCKELDDQEPMDLIFVGNGQIVIDLVKKIKKGIDN